MSHDDEQKPANASDADASKAAEGADEKASETKPLTKEEQLAAYEEALKHEDWGHQPC